MSTVSPARSCAARELPTTQQRSLRFPPGARPSHSAGEISRAGSTILHTALAKDLQVGLRRGMIPHVHVHGGGDHDRSRGRQIERGEKIAGDALREIAPEHPRLREPPAAHRSTAPPQCARSRNRCWALLFARSEHPVMTFSPESAAKVRGLTNSWAARVMTTCTRMPRSCTGGRSPQPYTPRFRQ